MNSTTAWETDSEDLPGLSAYKPGYEVPLLTVVCVLGFTGNTMVWLVYTKPKFRRTNAAMYILSLAAGDILALCVAIGHITEFFPTTWPVLYAYDWQCMVLRYFRFVGLNNTVLTMTAIAVDRFYAVKHPVAFKTRFTIKRTRVIVALIWVVTFIVSAPFAMMFRSKIYGGSGIAETYPGKLAFACRLVLSSFGQWFVTFKPIYLNGVLFYLPVIVTAGIYVSIVLHVWRNNKFVSQQMGHSPHRNSHWKTAKTLLTVFVVYVACYILFVTYNLFDPFAPGLVPAQIKNLGILLPSVNSCMNPMVYSFTNPSFRKACWDMACCRPFARFCTNGGESKNSKDSKLTNSSAYQSKGSEKSEIPAQMKVAVIPAISDSSEQQNRAPDSTANNI